MIRTSRKGFPFIRAMSLLMLSVLLASLLPFCGALAQPETLWLDAQFESPGSAKPRMWQFPYRDDLFAASADDYSHTLAQVSLGLALGAFRNKALGQDEQDVTVRAYLEEAGFSALTSQDYDRIPTVDTVSTVIGSKTLDGFTLMAVAICGGGYGNEWLSNFTVGDAERHVGFNGAARKVQTRIRDYMTAQGITGPVKLWIAGYSRAAAITNLVAADLTDSGLFADIFAYTFATPRTTKAPRDYPNIFNIIGKFDPVPMIPAPEWGYGRNGVDLYTPAAETDTDYLGKKAAADTVSQKLAGIAFFNNTGMNNTIHTILDYLLSIIPDSATYAEHMQDIMLSMWENRSLSNLSSMIVKMMEDEQLLNETTKREMEYLLDYLSVVTYSTVSSQVSGGDGMWNNRTTMLDNLAHEHSPDVYVCWLFSTNNPERLYSAADSYMRVTWKSTATANIFDTEGRFLFSIDGGGRVSYGADEPMWAATAQPVDERPLISYEIKNGTTVITFPRDGNYLIYLHAAQDEAMYYFGAEYKVNATRAIVDKTVITEMKKGGNYVIVSLRDEDAADGEHLMGSRTEDYSVWDEEFSYSPAFMTILQNSEVFHLTFGQMALIIGAVIMLLLVLIVWLTVHFVRRHKRRKKAGAAKIDV